MHANTPLAGSNAAKELDEKLGYFELKRPPDMLRPLPQARHVHRLRHHRRRHQGDRRPARQESLLLAGGLASRSPNRARHRRRYFGIKDARDHVVGVEFFSADAAGDRVGGS